MKLVALFGLAAGSILALGKLSVAQWHGIGAALLALTLAHGLTVLPWLLTFLFAGLWWRRQRDVTAAWRAGYSDQRSYYAARLTEQQQAAARQPQRRKRTAR